jgi:hypothetical protein
MASQGHSSVGIRSARNQKDIHIRAKSELYGVDTMRSVVKNLACSICLLALSACATTSTPYQPDTTSQRVLGGYSEQRLGDNRFKVGFHGNALTSRERVEGYMLYRAAELTVQNGYDWFRVVNRLTERDRQTYHEPRYNPHYGYGYWRPSWRYYRQRHGWYDWYPYYGSPFWADEVDIQTVEEFEAHAEVVMGRGPVPTDQEVFDARKVMSDLSASIERPKDRP